MRISEKGLPCRAIHQRMTNCTSCSWAVLHGTAVLAVNRSIIRAKKNRGKYALEKSILWKKRGKIRVTAYQTGNLSPFSPTCSLPDKFVCYLSPSAVSNLSRDEALSLARRITKNCPLKVTHRGINGERAPSFQTTEELQVIGCPASPQFFIQLDRSFEN